MKVSGTLGDRKALYTHLLFSRGRGECGVARIKRRDERYVTSGRHVKSGEGTCDKSICDDAGSGKRLRGGSRGSIIVTLNVWI